MQKFIFNFQNNHKIIQKIGLIDEFKGKWSQQILTDFIPLEKLRILALSDNSSASVRLEMPLTAANTSDIERNLYKNASHIVLNQATLFSHETIEHLYKSFVNPVTNNDFDEYRKPTSKLTLFIGDQPISFRAIPARNITQQLKQEIHKTITYLDEKQFHPLIVIADFLYEFIAICPFETHNLQLSRLIAQQLLFQRNYSFIEYLAFEAAFETRKGQYYVTLAKALNSRNQAKEDISEWIIFFLDCIELSINHLERRLKLIQVALNTLEHENFVLNEKKDEKSIKKQVVVKTEPPISKTVKNKKEKTTKIPATKGVSDKTDRILEQPSIPEKTEHKVEKSIIPEKTEHRIEKPITKEKTEHKIEKPITKEKSGQSIELPLSHLFEDNTTKIVDNQSVKSQKTDTTIIKTHNDNPVESDEMGDNPIEVEMGLSNSEVYLSPRQKKLKKFIVERQPIRLSDLKQAFPEINQHVIKKDLQYMQRMNEIQKIGDFKTAAYTANLSPK